MRVKPVLQVISDSSVCKVRRALVLLCAQHVDITFVDAIVAGPQIFANTNPVSIVLHAALIDAF